MLQVFVRHEGRLHFAKGAEAPDLGPVDFAVWLDLLNPTAQETARAKALLGSSLPTREEMAEIEESSRLKRLPNAQLMTVLALVWADTDRPRVAPVTFIITKDRLATLHHIDPQPMLDFRRKVARRGHPATNAEQVLMALLEGLIERTAAVLRRTAQDLDELAAGSFRGETLRVRAEDDEDDEERLRRIGRAGQLISKAHVSLSSLQRPLELLRGPAQPGQAFTPSKNLRQWAKGASQDVAGLDEYAMFLNQKVSLLLDTTLGEISGEQNEIIRIVTVISMAMLPPTMVASIFGMNFHHMPGMGSPWGYAAGLGLMALSIAAPLALFKRNGWL